jgi:poly(hydroxyalkanoate) depolymerase family esterase
MSKRLRASTVLKALKRVSQIPGPLTHFVSKKILGTLHPDMPRRAIPEGDETASAAALEPGNPGKFVERIYKSALGSRNYKVYIPKGYKSLPLPVVVMLHGCTQTPDDFAAGTGMNDLADRDGFLVIYPAQSAAANVLRCWNWFNPKDQDRARGEPSLIAGITLEISAEFAVDKQRIFVAGLSAGAAMAVILGATYPDLFSAVGAHSGLPYRAARGVTSALEAMRRGGPVRAKSELHSAQESANELDPIRTIVFHGDQDSTVDMCNGSAIIEQALGRAAQRSGPLLKVDVRRFENGRESTATAYLDSQARPVFEHWVVHGAGHAWSGGSPQGSYSDDSGPHASVEMVRFFLRRRVSKKQLLGSFGRILLWRLVPSSVREG